jgi:hypothetical protein
MYLYCFSMSNTTLISNLVVQASIKSDVIEFKWLKSIKVNKKIGISLLSQYRSVKFRNKTSQERHFQNWYSLSLLTKVSQLANFLVRIWNNFVALALKEIKKAMLKKKNSTMPKCAENIQLICKKTPITKNFIHSVYTKFASLSIVGCTTAGRKNH